MIEQIDRNQETAVDFLSALVRTPSDNPPGDCAAIAEVTAGWLETLGFVVERHPVPEDRLPSSNMIAATNLIVRQQFGPGPTIALNAHGDVVPPGDGWSSDPYAAEIRDGWMYGRGAAVSKSDIATYAMALRALKETAAKLGGTVELHITWDEETGGMAGPGWILEDGLSTPDLAICPGFSYAVTTAHNGCLHLDVTVTGRAAHAAQPDSGHDAIHGAVQIMQALYAYRETLAHRAPLAHRETMAGRTSPLAGIGHPTLVVGTVSGGTNTNVVAGHARFCIDRRITPEEDTARVESELTAVIDAATAGLKGISVDCRRILLARPLTPTAKAADLAAVIRAVASRIMGEDIGETAAPIYTDSRHYAEAGVPVVMYGAGPRSILEANGHRADERVALDDLNKATKVIALALVDLLPSRT
ncbi:M20/M25/M40 family metallo-hydrolase [Tistrella bauzanensis]